MTARVEVPDTAKRNSNSHPCPPADNKEAVDGKLHNRTGTCRQTLDDGRHQMPSLRIRRKAGLPVSYLRTRQTRKISKRLAPGHRTASRSQCPPPLRGYNDDWKSSLPDNSATGEEYGTSPRSTKSPTTAGPRPTGARHRPIQVACLDQNGEDGGYVRLQGGGSRTGESNMRSTEIYLTRSDQPWNVMCCNCYQLPRLAQGFCRSSDGQLSELRLVKKRGERLKDGMVGR